MFLGIKKENLNFPKEIQIKNNRFIIKIIELNKKNASVIVKKNILEFRIPKKLTQNKKNKILTELLEKITKKLEKSRINFNKNKNITTKLLQKKEFYFNNSKFKIEIVTKNKIQIIENKIQIPKKLITEKEIEKIISKILINKYKNKIIEIINKINKETYNYNIKEILIKNLKTKWGYCTFDNRIMINIKLLNSEYEILKYVIIHELSHIKFKNHSKQFWKNVEKFCPNYKKLRNKLKNNPPELFYLEKN